MDKQKGFTPIIILVGILILAGVVGGAYYFGKFNITKPQSQNPIVTSQTISTAPAGNFSQPSVIRLEDLRVIDRSLFDVRELVDMPDVAYYSAGSILEGSYKGYKRIVVIIQPWGMSEYLTKILATKDDKKFILDNSQEDVESYVNKKYISGMTDLSQSNPQTISLNDKFILSRSSAPYAELMDSGKKDEQGKPILEYRLISDFSSYSSLLSPNPNYKFYYKKMELNQLINNLTEFQKKDEVIRQQYLDSKTEVIVVDSQGLAYSYLMNNGSLGFNKSDITTSNQVYNKYDTAFPQACGGNSYTYIVKNISDQDLRKIGSEKGIDLYALINKSHSLNTLAYDAKILDYDGSSNSFKMANQNISVPTLEDYISKNPLLFMKDYWGRWVVFGEFDYYLLGGCGKPVIYLYPVKPTKVFVQFVSPMKLDVDIPTYNNGWTVLASPDGTLKDLQPEFTDCNKIDSVRKGSEYAKGACLIKTYPYLYWAGRSLLNKYPEVKGGWIVKKEDLSSFMDDKLNEIGLNYREKSDMLSYWMPEMLGKNAPYYKISFLQTPEMNNLIPMSVIPQPDTVFRIFLDYTPLDTRPDLNLQPQSLLKLNRNGFTLVEWGGLKR